MTNAQLTFADVDDSPRPTPVPTPPAPPAPKANAPFAFGSDTSQDAAESIQPHLNRLCGIVLDAIGAAGSRGMTCDEVEASLDLRHQTASARVHELGRSGKIVDSGERRVTRSGRKAAVWTAR